MQAVSLETTWCQTVYWWSHRNLVSLVIEPYQWRVIRNNNASRLITFFVKLIYQVKNLDYMHLKIVESAYFVDVSLLNVLSWDETRERSRQQWLEKTS